MLRTNRLIFVINTQWRTAWNSPLNDVKAEKERKLWQTYIFCQKFATKPVMGSSKGFSLIIYGRNYAVFSSNWKIPLNQWNFLNINEKSFWKRKNLYENLLNSKKISRNASNPANFDLSAILRTFSEMLSDQKTHKNR